MKLPFLNWILAILHVSTNKKSNIFQYTQKTIRKQIFLSLFIYFERERVHEQGRGREREGQRESQVGSSLSAHSPMRGLNPRTVIEIVTWAEIKSQMLNRLSQVPHKTSLDLPTGLQFMTSARMKNRWMERSYLHVKSSLLKQVKQKVHSWQHD